MAAGLARNSVPSEGVALSLSQANMILRSVSLFCSATNCSASIPQHVPGVAVATGHTLAFAPSPSRSTWFTFAIAMKDGGFSSPSGSSPGSQGAHLRVSELGDRPTTSSTSRWKPDHSLSACVQNLQPPHGRLHKRIPGLKHSQQSSPLIRDNASAFAWSFPFLCSRIRVYWLSSSIHRANCPWGSLRTLTRYGYYDPSGPWMVSPAGSIGTAVWNGRWRVIPSWLCNTVVALQMKWHSYMRSHFLLRSALVEVPPQWLDLRCLCPRSSRPYGWVESAQVG